MTINATAVWEHRPTGNNNNGGGFDPGIAGAGTDYSQQDAAQLALADIACAQNSTTITSVAGGFTSEMKGNAINIRSGTNFIAGFYFILDVTNSNTAVLDRSPATAGNGSNGAGNVGGARAQLLSAHWGNSPVNCAAGNVFWFKAGTYSHGATVSAGTAGSASAPCRIIGYKTTRGDTPLGDDRPLFNQNSYAISSGDNWQAYNIRFTYSGASTAFTTTSGGRLVNCKVTGTGVNSSAVSVNNGDLYACELIAGSTGGTALTLSGGKAFNCFIHGAYKGVNCSAAIFSNCVFSGCTYRGIEQSGASYGLIIINCIFHNCVTGVYATQSFFCGNCIFTSNSTCGVTRSVADTATPIDHCCFYGNGQDVTNVAKGLGCVDADPLFADAANSNFTVSFRSPCLGKGLGYGTMGLLGLPVSNIGLIQGVEGSGSGLIINALRRR